MMSKSDALTRTLTARGSTFNVFSQKETNHHEIASIRTNAIMVRQKITK